MRMSRLLFPVMLLAVTFSGSASTPPGKFYDIGNLRLHLNCIGSGEPTVLFDAGLGGFSLEWLAIQRQLAGDVKTCAYDRAGYGWSDSGPAPRVTSQINDEFMRLLQVAGLSPPYILVGHSFGGYNMQYFAKAYPGQVAGLVLVDSSHPDQADRIPDVQVRSEQHRRPQLVTTLNDYSVLELYPADVRDQAMQLLASRKAVITQQREMAGFTYSANEVDFLGEHFPDIPLVIVSRGEQQWPDSPLGIAREEAWQAMQGELVQLSSRGRHVLAESSGHMIHLEQPQLLVDIIRDMTRAQCRTRMAAADCD